jgi:hypothetical protein
MIFSLKSTFMSWVMRKRIHQIELFMKYPHDIQNELLFNLLQTAKETEWGLKYDFENIKTYEEFKKRIPISDYNDLRDDIERLRKGENNILWPSPSKWFAKSSGTSGSKSKYIPVTQESLIDCHFKGGKDMLSMYCENYPDTTIFNGKSVIMGGSHEPSLSKQTKDGDMSAIIVENLPFWVNVHQTPNKEIRLMNDFEEKIKQMAKITSKEDVTNISGVPSWILVLFDQILQETGAKNMQEVWPNMQLYMHGGINFDPYREQFKQHFPKPINYLETYNASEGFFGIQDQKNSDEMLLMLDYGIFYEFIPMDDFSYQNAIPIWKVQKDKNYALIISTNAGLWRYLIGDTITFTSTSPYRIKITGRTTQFINAFGEELIVENANQALKISCKLTNSIIKEFTVAPIFMNKGEKGAHEWFIEFEKEPTNKKEFLHILDENIKKLNSDYEAKRNKNLALEPPILNVVPTGYFYNWMKENNRLGRQFKIARLHNNREFVDSMFKNQTLSLKSYKFN